MKIKIPDFATQKELFDFLVQNETTLIAQKKAETKEADGVAFVQSEVLTDVPDGVEKGIVNKSDLLNKDTLLVKAIINTTNVIDSHLDLHVNGIWNKSVKENKLIMHVQEHKSNEFSKIIADGEDLKAFVHTYTWKQLGYDFDGTTQALVFESKVQKDRNPYMHEQYAKGRVKNHSVGMRYVKINMCINDEDYPTAKANWDNFYPLAINKEVADQYGYFWAVSEAKAIEGSAVPLGSNSLTPTISVKADVSHSDKQIEAEKSLHDKQKQFFTNLI